MNDDKEQNDLTAVDRLVVRSLSKPLASDLEQRLHQKMSSIRQQLIVSPSPTANNGGWLRLTSPVGIGLIAVLLIAVIGGYLMNGPAINRGFQGLLPGNRQKCDSSTSVPDRMNHPGGSQPTGCAEESKPRGNTLQNQQGTNEETNR